MICVTPTKGVAHIRGRCMTQNDGRWLANCEICGEGLGPVINLRLARLIVQTSLRRIATCVVRTYSPACKLDTGLSLTSVRNHSSASPPRRPVANVLLSPHETVTWLIVLTVGWIQCAEWSDISSEATRNYRILCADLQSVHTQHPVTARADQRCWTYHPQTVSSFTPCSS